MLEFQIALSVVIVGAIILVWTLPAPVKRAAKPEDFAWVPTAYAVLVFAVIIGVATTFFSLPR